MKKVYCLYRGSNEEIEAQKLACHIYAKLQGWAIIKEFSEENNDSEEDKKDKKKDKKSKKDDVMDADYEEK